MQTNYILHLFYIFSLLCSDYVTDLTEKLELRLTVVSILLKIRFGHSQISVPKIGIPMSKTACINPCQNMNKNPQGLLEMIPLQKEVSSFT